MADTGRSADWHHHALLFPRRAIDGKKIAGHVVMRRIVCGEAQYRQPTQQELDDYVSDAAW